METREVYVRTLKILRPGDHILTKKALRTSFLCRTVNKFVPCFVELDLPAHHHMLVVKPIDESTVDVMHVTKTGIRKQQMLLDPGKIALIEYECTFNGAQAIENARACFYREGYDCSSEEFVTQAKGKVRSEGEHVSAFENTDKNAKEVPIAVTYECRSITGLQELKKGDHIMVERLITHHLLFIERINNRILVIHKGKKGICEETKVLKPEEIKVCCYNCPYSGDEIIERARNIHSSLHWSTNNCEDFAVEARTGRRPASTQAKRQMVRLGIAAASGLVVGTASGTVAGWLLVRVPAGAAIGGLLGAIAGGIGGVGGVIKIYK